MVLLVSMGEETCSKLLTAGSAASFGEHCRGGRKKGICQLLLDASKLQLLKMEAIEMLHPGDGEHVAL